MFAIVEIQGRQYRVEAGQMLTVDRLPDKEKTKKNFTNVHLVKGDKVEIGSPFLKNAKVVATIEKHLKEKKTIVFKKKRRQGYRRLRGFRGQSTRLHIEVISNGTKESKAPATKNAPKKKAVAKKVTASRKKNTQTKKKSKKKGA